jgi:acyl carrier protein
MVVNLRTKVRNQISQRLRMKNKKVAFTDSDSLFVSGLLDSLDALETISFLEDGYGINFAEIEFDLTLLDSINAIAALVQRWQKTNS